MAEHRHHILAGNIETKQTRETPKERLIRMSKIAGVVLILVAALCGVIASLIMYQLSNYARRINIAGRQRALSEKITKNIALSNSALHRDTSDIGEYVLNARTYLAIFEESHQALLKGDSSLNIDGLRNEPWWGRHSSEIDRELDTLQPVFIAFVDLVRRNIVRMEYALASHQRDFSILDRSLEELVSKQARGILCSTKPSCLYVG